MDGIVMEALYFKTGDFAKEYFLISNAGNERMANCDYMIKILSGDLILARPPYAHTLLDTGQYVQLDTGIQQ